MKRLLGGKRENMNLIGITVEHLVLDGIKKLDKFILIPVAFVLMDDFTLDESINNEDHEIIEYIISNHKDLLEEVLELEYCTLAILKCENIENLSMSKVCYELERAFDYIAITQYRYDRREWTIGIPGSIAYAKTAYLFDTDNNSVKLSVEEKHEFCEVPGIGLEISFHSLARLDENLYSLVFSERNDEVYRICRTFITKACRTFYILDLNSVFSHLFASLEGIGMV